MVALHLAENGVWCVHEGRVWEASAAVVGGLDGSIQVAAAGDASVSPLLYMDDDHVMVDDRPVAQDAVLLQVLATALERVLDAQTRGCVRFTYPSEWGAARVGRVCGALRELGVTPEPVATSIAVSAARRRALDVPGRSSWVVIEPGAASITVSRVEPCPTGSRPGGLVISACELAFSEDVADAAISVSGGERVGEVLVTAGVDESLFSSVRDSIVERLGPVDVTLVRELDIAQGLDADEPVAQGCSPGSEIVSGSAARRPDWLGGLVRSQQHGVRRPRLTIVAGSVAGAVLAVAAGAVWISNGVGGGEAAEPAAAPRVPVAASTTPGPPATASGSPRIVDGLRFDVPVGWVEQEAVRVGSGMDSRVELVPTGRLPLRIVVVQNRLRDGIGLDEVTRTLAEKVATQPDAFVAFDPLSEFAGRSGASYSEIPDDGSKVRWFVLVEAGVQVSVGCQAADEDRGELHAACQSVVRSVSAEP